MTRREYEGCFLERPRNLEMGRMMVMYDGWMEEEGCVGSGRWEDQIIKLEEMVGEGCHFVDVCPL
jgi:hypothetical protein